MIKAVKKVKNRVENKLDTLLSSNSQVERELNRHSELLKKIELEIEQSKATPIIYLDKETILVKMFNGQLIYLSLNDVSVAPHIATSGVWESYITKAWLRNTNHNMIIMDIGANFGYFGLIASQMLDKKNSRVVYFEPNPSLSEYINKSIAINWLKENSVVVNKAVSDKKGKAKLSILEDFVGSSSLHSADHLNTYLANAMDIKVENELEVDTVSVDEYCAENNIDEVNLIKMDIEGFEDIAYNGMRDTVKRSKNLVFFIEFTGNSYKYPEKFFKKMQSDFNYTWLISEDGETIDVSRKSYKDLFKDIDDWVMIVFSKKDLNNE